MRGTGPARLLDGELLDMPDRVLTAEAAHALQDESDRHGELLTWAVMQTKDNARVVACPIAEVRGALKGALVAATLEEMHAQLPKGLARASQQSAAPIGLLEVWYSAHA